MKGRGGAITRAPIHYWSAEILQGCRMIAGAPKNPQNVISTLHLLLEDFKIEN